MLAAEPVLRDHPVPGLGGVRVLEPAVRVRHVVAVQAFDGVVAAGLGGPHRRSCATRGHSMAGQVSMTMGTPAAVVRAKASSSITPSWNHTALAPTATA